MNRTLGLVITIALCALCGACQEGEQAVETPAPTPTPQVDPSGDPAPAITEPDPIVIVDDDPKTVIWAPAVDPKPLTQETRKGLAWLVAHQLPSGAWGQGEESQHMGAGSGIKDTPSVADTCVAALALIRSGSTPSEGEYATSILAAVNFVCSEVEQADDETLYITKTRGTRVQSKLGPYIDTFLASMLLAEAKNAMPDEASTQRATNCLRHIVGKMEANQREDGTWSDQGWAAALSQSMAVKGLNRAAQGGERVSVSVRERSGKYARDNFDEETGSFGYSGSAGVDLYASAATYGAQSDSDNTSAVRKLEVQSRLREDIPADERDGLETELKQIEDSEKTLAATASAIVDRLNDEQFIAGFGSNGGEEFLSYMNISEGLVVKGGDAWKQWDASITANLNRIQNGDGSWTGHHCITGRTFCTSAALLVLLTDRAPVPVAALGSE